MFPNSCRYTRTQILFVAIVLSILQSGNGAQEDDRGNSSSDKARLLRAGAPQGTRSACRTSPGRRTAGPATAPTAASVATATATSTATAASTDRGRLGTAVALAAAAAAAAAADDGR